MLRAQRFSPSALVLPRVVETVIAEMGGAYPALVRDAELLATTIAHEEEAFRRTLRQGSALIEDVLAAGTTTISGDVAFRLHDTFGFPIELTTELARERGVISRVSRKNFTALSSEFSSASNTSARSAVLGCLSVS